MLNFTSENPLVRTIWQTLGHPKDWATGIGSVREFARNLESLQHLQPAIAPHLTDCLVEANRSGKMGDRSPNWQVKIIALMLAGGAQIVGREEDIRGLKGLASISEPEPPSLLCLLCTYTSNLDTCPSADVYAAAVRRLVEEAKLDPNDVDSGRYSCLELALTNNMNLLMPLIESGADPRVGRYGGQTLAEFAVTMNNSEAAEIIRQGERIAAARDIKAVIMKVAGVTSVSPPAAGAI